MLIVNQISELQTALQPFRIKKQSIGFVPTMGALHKGHLSLISRSLEENKVTVVSIYVNPTQFNNPNDLKNYPRNLQKDIALIEQIGNVIIFAPSDKEMYPKADNRTFELGLLASIMEGEHRPGHFNGVVKIVSKLFDGVLPQKAYFGQKDFQQLAVIRWLVKEFNYNIDIIACPIVREDDGLAMSSRNMLLSAEHRKVAPLIYKSLQKIISEGSKKTVLELKELLLSSIQLEPLLKTEYFEIVDTFTLQPTATLVAGKSYTACVAVFASEVRLIDNVEFIL